MPENESTVPPTFTLNVASQPDELGDPVHIKREDASSSAVTAPPSPNALNPSETDSLDTTDAEVWQSRLAYLLRKAERWEETRAESSREGSSVKKEESMDVKLEEAFVDYQKRALTNIISQATIQDTDAPRKPLESVGMTDTEIETVLARAHQLVSSMGSTGVKFRQRGRLSREVQGSSTGLARRRSSRSVSPHPYTRPRSRSGSEMEPSDWHLADQSIWRAVFASIKSVIEARDPPCTVFSDAVTVDGRNLVERLTDATHERVMSENPTLYARTHLEIRPQLGQ